MAPRYRKCFEALLAATPSAVSNSGLNICRDDMRQQAIFRINDYIVGLYNVMRRLAYAETTVRDFIPKTETER